jgi:hypothetical protein
MDLTPLVLVGGVLLIGVAMVLSYRSNAKRRQKLMAYAASRGWSYRAEDPALAVRWNAAPFGQGDRRRATNVVLGQDRNRPFVAFDYRFETESNDGNGNRTTTTHRYAVVALALPTFLPGLEVTPDNVLSRAASAMGLGHDINLESDDFNRRFRVSSGDPKFASDVLGPRTMQALLSAPTFSWRIIGSDLLAWWTGALDPVQALAHLSTMQAVLDGVPAFVWHDHGVDVTSAVRPPEGGASA